jgi:hypothetical protein
MKIKQWQKHLLRMKKHVLLFHVSEENKRITHTIRNVNRQKWCWGCCSLTMHSSANNGKALMPDDGGKQKGL